MSGSKKYDFIFSLGGNCAAAHNLRYKNMRPFTLPFDWLYIDSIKPIDYLSIGFQNNFRDFCKKDNLKKIAQNESHKEFVSYLDTYTGFYFFNHFKREINNTDEFEVFDKKNKKRLSRLLKQFSKSKNVLGLLSINFELDVTNSLQALTKTLKTKYPCCNIDFSVLEFNTKADKTINIENITVNKYSRAMNDDDYFATNFEWDFLDEIVVKTVSKINTKEKLYRKIIKSIPCKKLIKKIIHISFSSFKHEK